MGRASPGASRCRPCSVPRRRRAHRVTADADALGVGHTAPHDLVDRRAAGGGELLHIGVVGLLVTFCLCKGEGSGDCQKKRVSGPVATRACRRTVQVQAVTTASKLRPGAPRAASRRCLTLSHDGEGGAVQDGIAARQPQQLRARGGDSGERRPGGACEVGVCVRLGARLRYWRRARAWPSHCLSRINPSAERRVRGQFKRRGGPPGSGCRPS